MEKRSVKAGFHTSLLFILHVLYIVYTSEPEKESDIEKACLLYTSDAADD